MVAREGLEATLQALIQAGVYVTLEEIKGRTPIVRGQCVLDVSYDSLRSRGARLEEARGP